MIKNLNMFSPTPNVSPRLRPSFFRPGFSQRPGISFSLVFTLLCLILSLSSASAQERDRETTAQSEERLRRVDEENQADKSESRKIVDANQMAQPHVRKTSMTYSPRSGNQTVAGPSLTNDIVIISRAEETAPMRRLGAVKAGSSSSSIPSTWPVLRSLRSGVGVRNNPFGGSSVEYHKGQDIAAPTGTPINVTADGVVVVAGWVNGYGNGIYVDHGNGITTRYGHLSRIDVVVGQSVKRGAHLGLVGSTGRSTGPHLHYEVRINGQPTSPMLYMPSVAPQFGGQ